MFTIEHEFDATVVTLVDEGAAPLREDLTINLFDDGATVEQFDPRSGETVSVNLSAHQLRDLAMALDLPEGTYRRMAEKQRRRSLGFTAGRGAGFP